MVFGESEVGKHTCARRVVWPETAWKLEPCFVASQPEVWEARTFDWHLKWNTVCETEPLNAEALWEVSVRTALSCWWWKSETWLLVVENTPEWDFHHSFSKHIPMEQWCLWSRLRFSVVINTWIMIVFKICWKKSVEVLKLCFMKTKFRDPLNT